MAFRDEFWGSVREEVEKETPYLTILTIIKEKVNSSIIEEVFSEGYPAETCFQ